MEEEAPTEAPDSKPPAEEPVLEKVLASGITLRTSARVSKKLKQDQEASYSAFIASPEKKCAKEEIPQIEDKPKARRAPTFWSPEEKSAFFEALNENGKNFEAIERYLASKAKKRGEGGSKNREQARHFYHRTLHKLSKHVKMPESIKKVTQELYALINFGEFRKKVGHVTEKNAMKLNELIYAGSTQVRVRGKSWRVKTPVCRALRKLNQFEEDWEEVKLPNRVEVLIGARTNRDWTKVQMRGHNPRIKATISLDCQLDTLISFLSNKWNKGHEGTLKLGPKEGTVIEHPMYKCGPIVTSRSVSLMAHERRVGGGYEAVKSLLHLIQLGKTKSMLKWHKEDDQDDEFTNTDLMDPSDVDKEEFEARIRDGWSVDVPSRLRVGQLYVILGSKGSIELDYWWESKDAISEFSKTLERLTSIASLYFSKNKVQCPCGHVCRSKGQATPAQAKPKAKPKQKIIAESQAPDKIELLTNQPNPNDLPMATTIPHEGSIFKRPILPSTQTQQSTVEFPTMPFRPKYCNRRGRARQRNLVVQRILPLLPKAPPGQVMLTLQMFPPPGGGTLINNTNNRNSTLQVPTIQPQQTLPMRTEEAETEPQGSEKEVAQQSSGNTFSGVLGQGGQTQEVTPPTSPTSILKEGEWLSSEIPDFSFSSFLSHLEAPFKMNGTNEDTHMSVDVESHFQSLMAETSLDYTAKFAELAAKVSNSSTVEPFEQLATTQQD